MNNEEKQELDKVIFNLEQQGVTPNNYEEVVGLGDMVESTLKRLGITEERFKSWFNLRECNCSKRKKWLNNVLSWRKKK
tara:strand:+ start:142 stop:378 length:237 start_codon:yes stop_codon:yes gene_type:complete